MDKVFFLVLFYAFSNSSTLIGGNFEDIRNK